jgi:hypothetical protein
MVSSIVPVPAAPPIVTVMATPSSFVSVSEPEPRARVARTSTFCADVDAAAALYAAAAADTAVPAAFVCAHSLQTMLLMHLARHAPKSLPTNVRRLAEQTSQ